MSTSAPAPTLDPRSYQDLVDEALARIPIHNPEWTNFNRSDPGVTLVELFAFLTESLLYRANQIPERNRRAFLSLLGVPLRPAASAQGIVTLTNATGPQQTITLTGDLELDAGQVPFRTDVGLDLLPVDMQACYKQPLANPPAHIVDYYGALYASYKGSAPDATQLSLYQTTPLAAPQAQAQPDVDLAQTVDRSLWIALLLRRVDGTADTAFAQARTALAGRTLSLGIVPILDDPDAQLSPLGRAPDQAQARLDYQLPRVAPSGSLGADPGSRVPAYRSLDQSATVNVLDQPGVVQLTLPTADGLGLWEDLDPLELGAGDLPPALDDPSVAARVITWLRIQAGTGGQAKLLWAGINAATVSQRASVAGEVLPSGTGMPDQSARLANTPVLPDTVVLRVGDPPVTWTLIDDLLTAGAEVPVPDLRLAPGAPQPAPAPSTVFTVDAATGIVTFGDGVHGARPPADAPIRADYAYGQGPAGNVGAAAITTGPVLPAGVNVSNPVRTWGGAAADTVQDAERQISRYLQHRDRLVCAADFESIVRRTPGVDVGRVDVIPAFSPELAASSAGQAAGAVTLMLIPRVDALHPGAPQPDQPFLDAVCSYIDSRRLVTTEVFLRGPTYVAIWLSVGFDPVAGQSVATVRDAIKSALELFLAPLGTATGPDDAPSAPADASFPHSDIGWPRLKPVVPLELLAVASRVPGVDLVRPVLLAAGDGAASDSSPVTISGLQLPYLAGISVQSGDPLPLDQVRGLAPSSGGSPGPPSTVVPVPVVPDSC
jgi:Baseplate J-like protein